MILFENINSETHIQSAIGKPLEFSFRTRKSLGSGGFYLHKFNSKNNELIEEGSKCNIQLYEKGFCIKCNYSNKLTFLPILFEDLKSVSLTREKETVSPYFLSLFWLLLKLDVALKTARYFGYKRREYRIDYMHLNIETDDFNIDLKANGFMFERQLRFFKTLNLSNVLHIIIKPPLYKKQGIMFYIIAYIIALIMIAVLFFCIVYK